MIKLPVTMLDSGHLPEDFVSFYEKILLPYFFKAK